MDENMDDRSRYQIWVRKDGKFPDQPYWRGDNATECVDVACSLSLDHEIVLCDNWARPFVLWAFPPGTQFEDVSPGQEV